MLVYWGCGATPTLAQPRTFPAEHVDDEALPVALAPRPFRDRSPAAIRRVAEPEPKMATYDALLERGTAFRGTHELRLGREAVSFRAVPDAEFLEPVDVTGIRRSAEGHVHLAWKPLPRAVAYLVSVNVESRATREMVIWTSSRVPESGWVLAQSHPEEALAELRTQGVLLPAHARECVIPAAVAGRAEHAMVVQVHAYAPPLSIETNAYPASGLPQRVRIAPRSTGTVLLIRNRDIVHAAEIPDAAPIAGPKGRRS